MWHCYSKRMYYLEWIVCILGCRHSLWVSYQIIFCVHTALPVHWVSGAVMNLVATHYNCTSPMDYISHHTLHSHIPIHHHTNHTAVTNHSFALIASPHLHLIHPLTYKQHTYTHPLRSLVLPWLTFPSGFPSVSFCVLPGLLTLSPDRLLPASLTPPALWLCSLVILSVCRLTWPIALPLFTYPPCLRCPRYLCLIFACLTPSFY